MSLKNDLQRSQEYLDRLSLALQQLRALNGASNPMDSYKKAKAARDVLPVLAVALDSVKDHYAAKLLLRKYRDDAKGGAR